MLKQRVMENSPYENVYTLALRGLHDKAMGGSNDMKERVKMLEEALMDQRQLLVDVLKSLRMKFHRLSPPIKRCWMYTVPDSIYLKTLLSLAG